MTLDAFTREMAKIVVDKIMLEWEAFGCAEPDGRRCKGRLHCVFCAALVAVLTKRALGERIVTYPEFHDGPLSVPYTKETPT